MCLEFILKQLLIALSHVYLELVRPHHIILLAVTRDTWLYEGGLEIKYLFVYICLHRVMHKTEILHALWKLCERVIVIVEGIIESIAHLESIVTLFQFALFQIDI